MNPSRLSKQTAVPFTHPTIVIIGFTHAKEMIARHSRTSYVIPAKAGTQGWKSGEEALPTPAEHRDGRLNAPSPFREAKGTPRAKRLRGVCPGRDDGWRNLLSR